MADSRPMKDRDTPMARAEERAAQLKAELLRLRARICALGSLHGQSEPPSEDKDKPEPCGRIQVLLQTIQDCEDMCHSAHDAIERLESVVG